MVNVDITDLSLNLGTEATNCAAWEPDVAGTRKMADVMACSVAGTD